MREPLKKKGREGKVEAFVKGLNSKGALAENIFKDNNTNLELAELSTNLDAEGKEYEDPDDKISNGLGWSQ
ncbi:hypothetical protein BY996DRAFT_6595015 [Phakopsora pachyrhizi]|nr:hypothetical protein BY996DRAFT_6595015 [Phakopsora pachyrhizi]